MKVQTQFEGLHKWSGAPEDSFLRNYHRHLFKVSVKIEVRHDDRELEFFDVKQKLDDFIDYHFAKQDFEASCEMIAKHIIDFCLLSLYDERRFEVEVSEDGENSGIVIYQPDLAQ
jgi:6-pyruvoyl-tetrahydropterin synthase